MASWLMSAIPLKADISEWLIWGDFKPLVPFLISGKSGHALETFWCL